MIIDQVKPRRLIIEDKPKEAPKTEPKEDRGADPEGATVIYSEKLKQKLYPYRDPETGIITAITTEDGACLLREDIGALKIINDVFGIDSIQLIK